MLYFIITDGILSSIKVVLRKLSFNTTHIVNSNFMIFRYNYKYSQFFYFKSISIFRTQNGGNVAIVMNPV